MMSRPEARRPRPEKLLQRPPKQPRLAKKVSTETTRFVVMDENQDKQKLGVSTGYILVPDGWFCGGFMDGLCACHLVHANTYGTLLHSP